MLIIFESLVTSFRAALSLSFFIPATVLCAISSDVFPGLNVVLIYCSVWLLKCTIVEMHPMTWFFRFSGSQHCGHVHCAYQYREHYHCMDPECNYQVSVSTSSLF